MTRPPADLLAHALSHAPELPSWPLADWELLIRQAREADLLARIDSQLLELGLQGEDVFGLLGDALDAAPLAGAQDLFETAQ
mgnify:CR=1 FL=1